MIRLLARLGTAVAVAASVLMVPALAPEPPVQAQAADLGYFDPGNIMSDAVFFDGLATDENAVQAFLAAKGASCVAGEQPCLKDYRQTTATQPGDAYCSTYAGAPNELASSIIVKVGRACGINPRVLVVLLQKEQGLVTGTRPATVRYTKATGFACPDTSACNPEFSGFASQVYFAARQFDRYAAGAAGSYRAGRINNVLYNPNPACGSSPVFIQNKATAGLYSYTPYQPNAAALAAGYGTGDGCSAYGNRNFWNYFTDWFGSTQSPGASAILTEYQSMGGSSGSLGGPTSGYLCGLRSDGCWQSYANGAIYWSPGTGAHFVRGSIRATWGSVGWETGGLGYPVTDESCGLAAGGCWQQFQGGSVYWTPALGANAVTGAILDRWAAAGWENGSLGYPTGAMDCRDSRCTQTFQGGLLAWNAGGRVLTVSGAIYSGYLAEGGRTVVGTPLIDESCGLAAGGCWQQFQNAAVYWSPATGVRVISGAIRDAWGALGFENSTLGYPSSGMGCLGNGTCLQSFQGGVVVASGNGRAFAVTGAIMATYNTEGGLGGWLGAPVAPAGCGLVGGGCWQQFTGGSIYWSPASGNYAVRGAILSGWGSLGWENSWLGYPTSGEVCQPRSTSCTSTFQNGAITWTPASGPVATSAVINSTWFANGGPSGSWGTPMSTMVCHLAQNGCSQRFTGGAMYWTPATGAHLVRGAILSVWSARGAERSGSGFPTTDEVCGLAGGGCMVTFQNGAMVWSPTTGVNYVTGAVLAAWQTSGGSAGPWGYPESDSTSDGSGTSQEFQGGRVSLDATSGAATLVP